MTWPTSAEAHPPIDTLIAVVRGELPPECVKDVLDHLDICDHPCVRFFEAIVDLRARE